MPEYIDVLTPKIQEGGKFIVDTSGVLSVDLQPAMGAVYVEMFAGGGASIFRDGDCFKILSVGYYLPDSFVMYQYPHGGVNYPFPIIQLGMLGVGGAGPFVVREFGNNGQFRLPFYNYEMAVGTFTDPTGSSMTDPLGFSLRCIFPLTAGLQHPQVSMVGVPATLDGITIDVTPFVKVMHNFPLT